MARIFTIDSIEGNSNLGNPVFSNFGKMQNYQYIALSPSKEDRADWRRAAEQEPALDKDNMQFKVKKPMDKGGGGDGTQTMSLQERRQQIHDVLVSATTLFSLLIDDHLFRAHMTIRWLMPDTTRGSAWAT